MGFFSLPIPVPVVPPVAAIADDLTRYPALNTMEGPYNAENPDTEGVNTRKIFPVPHPFAGLWIINEDTITWQQIFGTINPIIVTEGKEDAYQALI